MMFRRRLLISLLQLTADQSLFKRVLNNELHVLQPLLPDKTNSCYKLHRRKHDRQLIRKSAHLNDSFIRCENVVQRLIFTFLFFYETFRPNCMSLFKCLCLVAVCQLFLYEYMDMDMEFLYVRWDLTVDVDSLSLLTRCRRVPLVLELLLWLTAGWSWVVNRTERILLWSCWQRQTAGPLKRPSSSTIFLHNRTGSVASCYKSHRLPTSLRPLNCGFINTTSMCRLKSFDHTVESPYWLFSRDVII